MTLAAQTHKALTIVMYSNELDMTQQMLLLLKYLLSST